MANLQELENGVPREALASFLEEFLNGILKEGLMQPLKRWTEANGGPVSVAARAWYEAMLAGQAPGDALRSATFPEVISDVLAEGIARATLDYAVQDILKVLKDPESNVLDELDAVLADYRSRPWDAAVCTSCVQRDLIRLLDRAIVENAVEVRVRHDGAGTMEQQFAGLFPVRIIQPASARVVEALRHLLDAGGEVAPGVHVRNLAPGRFAVARGSVRVELVVEP